MIKMFKYLLGPDKETTNHYYLCNNETKLFKLKNRKKSGKKSWTTFHVFLREECLSALFPHILRQGQWLFGTDICCI